LNDFGTSGGTSQGPVPAQAGNGRGIWVRGARRTFGAFAAVDRVDLEAPPGAVTALVGPSGAGKTTLLLMLATLLGPDSGDLRVAGYDPVRAPGQVRARMGWMPDSFGAFETLTAREVLEFVAAAYRFSRLDRAARAAELLERVGLREYADRPVSVLSLAQKQRLGLARAIVHRPGVVLLDDPAGSLDAANRRELARLLRRADGSRTDVVRAGGSAADDAAVRARPRLANPGRGTRAAARRAGLLRRAPLRVRGHRGPGDVARGRRRR